MRTQKVLEQLGYKRKEAELYLAALLLGEAKVADLAAKLKIPRSSAVMIAEKLHKEGLLNYYVKRFHKYWVAESPDKLLTRVRNDEATIRSILPELKAMQHSVAEDKPLVKTFSGRKEIKLMLGDILSTKNNFKAVIAWNDCAKLLSGEYISDFIEMQTEQFLKMQLIVPRNNETMHLKAEDGKNFRETRFLPEGMTLDTATFIYEKKVAIISFSDSFPTGFLIEDCNVHHTMSGFFEGLWGSR